MDAYKNKIYFHLPGAFEFAKLYKTLLYLYKNNREKFKDNFEIASIHGCPGNLIWNGGRLLTYYIPNEQILDVKDMYEEYNIPVRFTFTNCLITNEHVGDVKCNQIAEMFSNGKNEILCNSKELEKYLRKKYNYSFISSTTKRLLNINDIKDETKNYKLVVLDYSLNKNMDVLKSIKRKDKIEILCNSCCSPNCKMRSEHYRNISECQLYGTYSKEYSCNKNNTFNKACKEPHFISVEDINDYSDLGFVNFKLEGRTNPLIDLVEILLYYLVKEEYKMEIRYILLFNTL